MRFIWLVDVVPFDAYFETALSILGEVIENALLGDIEHDVRHFRNRPLFLTKIETALVEFSILPLIEQGGHVEFTKYMDRHHAINDG